MSEPMPSVTVADEDLPSAEWVADEIDRLSSIGEDDDRYPAAQEILAHWRKREARMPAGE